MKKREQAQIYYHEVMELGFKETKHDDQVYYKLNGYEYSIVQLDLTKKISIDWDKETKLCEMIRIDNKRDCNIISKKPIRSLEHLKETINFFLSKN